MKIRAQLDHGSRVSHTRTIKPEPVTAEALHDLGVMLEDLGFALDHGAFAAATGQPGCVCEQRVEPDKLVARFDLEGSDVRYARVLRNQLYAFEQVNQIGLDVEAVQTPPAQKALALTVDHDEVERETFYPSLLPQLPFRLELLDAERADRNRRALVELAAPLDAPTERALAELVLCWSRLGVWLCAQRNGPSRRRVRRVRGDRQQLRRGQLRRHHRDVHAPEAAWSSLINITNLKGPRCVQVEIE